MPKDPVCGKDLEPGSVSLTSGRGPTKHYHDGVWYYFCSLRCRSLFVNGIEGYVSKAERPGAKGTPGV